MGRGRGGFGGRVLVGVLGLFFFLIVNVLKGFWRCWDDSGFGFWRFFGGVRRFWVGFVGFLGRFGFGLVLGFRR